MQTEALEKQIITWMLLGLSPGCIEDGGDDTVAIFLPDSWKGIFDFSFLRAPLDASPERLARRGAPPERLGWLRSGRTW
jgi:hypothetical protein